MANEQSKHTPLPWRLDERTSFDGGKYVSGVVGPNGTTVRVEWFTLSSGPEAQANAAFIARACNSHEDLLEACKRLMVCMALAGWESDPAAEFARAAIQKAEA